MRARPVFLYVTAKIKINANFKHLKQETNLEKILDGFSRPPDLIAHPPDLLLILNKSSKAYEAVDASEIGEMCKAGQLRLQRAFQAKQCTL